MCFVGWKKEHNPVLTNPKVVTKVDERVMDVALSVSEEIIWSNSLVNL